MEFRTETPVNYTEDGWDYYVRLYMENSKKLDSFSPSDVAKFAAEFAKKLLRIKSNEMEKQNVSTEVAK
jgi:hypothetical protein